MRNTPRSTDELPSPADGAGLPAEEILLALAHPRRRLVVSLLRERRGPTSGSDLARAVIAREHDRPRAAVDENETEQARADLHHRHLPKLAAAGLVAWDRETSTAALGDHAALDRPVVTDATTNATGDPDETWDEVLPALARRQRQRVLVALERADRPLATAELAEAVAVRERGEPNGSVPDAVVETTRAELRHVDLPALAEVSLVVYDPDQGTVARRDHPVVDWVVDDTDTQRAPVATVESDGV